MNSLFDWGQLGTVSGVVAAVNILLQFSKMFLKRTFPNVPMRVWELVYSLVVLACVYAFQSQLTPQMLPLLILNTLLVTMTTSGCQDLICMVNEPEDPEKPDP